MNITEDITALFKAAVLITEAYNSLNARDKRIFLEESKPDFDF